MQQESSLYEFYPELLVLFALFTLFYVSKSLYRTRQISVAWYAY
jgi:hypothetical protein